MKPAALLLLSVLQLSFVAVALAEQTDQTGCKDHPLVTRMPTYWIRNCQHIDFDSHEFLAPGNKSMTVEGEYWRLDYYPQATATTKPSALQVLRNYQNAIQGLGGTVLAADKVRETLKLTKDGHETWIQVWTSFTGSYRIEIVQKKAMAQDVTADATALATGLKATGHIAVEGIFFDTGKAELKPESQAAIGEIAKLLKADPALKLYVVGHTDNVGLLDANLKLSQARADAVVQALVTTHAIPAARLRAFGHGPTTPVSSNATEAGRALNRRVELVQQ